MEYTDQQRVAFKDVYAKRFRKRLVGMVLLFASWAVLPFTEGAGESAGPVLAVILLIAIFAGWGIFESRNWLCPACNEYLGRAFNPTHCRRCGVELRGTSPRSGVR